MSSSKNYVSLIGNLTRDPESRQVGAGSVCNFTLATSDSWFDKASGQRKESTEFHRIAFWGKAGETIQAYAKKGEKMGVDGSLETREWNDKAGVKHTTTSIKGREFYLMGSAQKQPAQQQSPQAPDVVEQELPF